MIHAEIRPTGDAAPETSGIVVLNSGGTLRAECLDALAGDDADRLDAIAGRAASMKLLMGILSFEEQMSEVAQDMFRMIGREADAIYALSIQRNDATKALLS